jgi:hypothetical protein
MPRSMKAALQRLNCPLPSQSNSCTSCRNRTIVEQTPCHFPLCRSSDAQVTALHHLGKPVALCGDHSQLLQAFRIQLLEGALFEAKQRAVDLAINLSKARQAEENLNSKVESQNSLIQQLQERDQAFQHFQQHQSTIVHDSIDTFSKMLRDHEVELNTILKPKDNQYLASLPSMSSVVSTLEEECTSFQRALGASLRSQREALQSAIHQAQASAQAASELKKDFVSLQHSYAKVQTEFSKVLLDHAKVEEELRVKKGEVAKVCLLLQAEREREVDVSRLIAERITDALTKSKKRRMREKKRRAKAKAERKAKEENGSESKREDVDGSGFERMERPEEALLWLFENNYSISDLERWNRFARGMLPFKKHKLKEIEKKWKKTAQVEERLITINQKPIFMTYVKFVEEVKRAINSRINDLPKDGKIEICIRGDGRVHHGDNSIVVMFSLPNLPDSQSDVRVIDLI